MYHGQILMSCMCLYEPTGEEKNPFLQQAYMQLRNVAETRPAVDAPDPFGQDLYVLCAEIAFQVMDMKEIINTHTP